MLQWTNSTTIKSYTHFLLHMSSSRVFPGAELLGGWVYTTLEDFANWLTQELWELISTPIAVSSHQSTCSPMLEFLKLCHLVYEMVYIYFSYAFYSAHASVWADSLFTRVGQPHSTTDSSTSNTHSSLGYQPIWLSPVPTSVPSRQREIRAGLEEGCIFSRPGSGRKWELVAGAIWICQQEPYGFEPQIAGFLTSRNKLNGGPPVNISLRAYSKTPILT